MGRTTNPKLAQIRKKSAVRDAKVAILDTKKRGNQYKPCPPDSWLYPYLKEAWDTQLTDQQVLDRITHDMDTSKYQIGIKTISRRRDAFALYSCRKDGVTHDELHVIMQELRPKNLEAGYEEIRKIIREEKGRAVSRSMIEHYCRTYEPDLIKGRLRRRLRRRTFWAAGVNDVLAFDQHDKWLHRFGLGLHCAVDGFSGFIPWLKIWHNNRNPKLIASYYLDFVEELEAMPMVTQSDPGKENVGIANAHTALRQIHDPRLVGTLQHRTMRNKTNIMPEIIWSQMRRRWAPDFERILQKGVDNGDYDVTDPLDQMIFRWVFIPWLQDELNKFRNRINHFKKRNDPRKARPQGQPLDLYFNAYQYDVLDFKIGVEKKILQEVRERYAPSTDPVFRLVPPEVETMLEYFWTEIGSPEILRESVWKVYIKIKKGIQHLNNPMRNPASWANLLSSIKFDDIGYNQLIPHDRVVAEYQPQRIDNEDEDEDEEAARESERNHWEEALADVLQDEDADILAPLTDEEPAVEW
ncbi:hypothetical protein NP233_g12020 [Leucocoprinus birnbaumii]|uniref:Integrase core domain-containing protein n=1 Tax=Leucocoprinus birnbaumii TaxID=56174 RepID=A0AAD5VFB4_9AGAR|nr:hypothetical protein NP233_g12020 [Leucocoprinus birnbaumii]